MRRQCEKKDSKEERFPVCLLLSSLIENDKSFFRNLGKDWWETQKLRNRRHYSEEGFKHGGGNREYKPYFSSCGLIYLICVFTVGHE